MLTEAGIEEICSELARRLGLGKITPRVIGRFSNLVVALDPLPIVARIATGTALVRDAQVFARREVSIASFLASRGAAVTPPCDPSLAGPHDVAGWTVSLWRLVDIVETPPGPGQAARRLRECHGLLREYPGDAPHFGAFDELEKVLAHRHVCQVASEADLAFIAQEASQCRRKLEAFSARYQILHGDAHRKNVFNSPAGPLWADWEDAIYAPVEWDLACLVTGARINGRDCSWEEEALAAYGEYDAAALDLCIRARALFGFGWLCLLSAADPGRLERVPIWLEWIRGR